MDSDELGINHILVTSHYTAVKALGAVDAAVSYLNEQRSRLGAYQNRLEHSISNVDNAEENLAAAESRIRDTDMADEMMHYSKYNIFQQANFAVMANANRNAEGILQLLQQ